MTGQPRRTTPRIGDVARRAGVSTATVSRALTGAPHVSPDLRERVLAAAAELGYVVSPSASRLASGQTRSVAVVAPFLDRWFFGQVLAAVEEVLREAGYDVLLYGLPNAAAREAFFTDLPVRRRVDAVLVLTLPLTASETDALLGLGVPVGAVGVRAPGLSSVGIDDEAGALAAVNHLLNLGHTRIGMIGGGTSDDWARFTVSRTRARGYRAALIAAGQEIPTGYQVDGRFTFPGGVLGMAQLLAHPTPPTAVFAQSDEMAMGALDTLRHAGLTCPGDVSIIGFDDHELAELIDLTTIGQPVSAQGRAAARDLVTRMATGAAPTVTTLPTRLILRATTRVLALT